MTPEIQSIDAALAEKKKPSQSHCTWSESVLFTQDLICVAALSQARLRNEGKTVEPCWASVRMSNCSESFWRSCSVKHAHVGEEVSRSAPAVRHSISIASSSPVASACRSKSWLCPSVQYFSIWNAPNWMTLFVYRGKCETGNYASSIFLDLSMKEEVHPSRGGWYGDILNSVCWCTIFVLIYTSESEPMFFLIIKMSLCAFISNCTWPNSALQYKVTSQYANQSTHIASCLYCKS